MTADPSGGVPEDMPPRKEAAVESRRRVLLNGGAVAAATMMGAVDLSMPGQAIAAPRLLSGYLNVRSDFRASGDGEKDDTRALQSAIDAGAERHCPVVIPPGTYRITRPLRAPSNCMLMGSAPGLGFGCRIEPVGCAALEVGGERASFHCYFENLMIWPKGAAPDHILSIDNSYSVTFRNIRIHDTQQALKGAAVSLLGDPAAGGHGACNNILWDNLVIRNDTGQPATAMRAAPGCGSHRFLMPCLENFAVLLEWNGGQLDLFAPYTERAGRYAVNCDVHPLDPGAYLNVFGGFINSAESGLACAIRATTAALNSFGTQWGNVASRAAYVYSIPPRPAQFHGITPNVSGRGLAQFAGVEGWTRALSFPGLWLRGSKVLRASLPVGGRESATVRIAGVQAGIHWAKAYATFDAGGAQVDAYVMRDDEVLVTIRNGGSRPIELHGAVIVECGWPA